MVCNDHGAFVEPDRLYRNDGPGADGTVFTDVGAALGAEQAIYCMGIAAGDVDGDLRMDYYLSNLGANALLMGGPGPFVDAAAALGVSLATEPCPPHLLLTAWGSGFHDFDRDGRLDLYVSQGQVPADDSIANAEIQASALFTRLAGAEQFVDVGPLVGLAGAPGFGRGAAFADYDRDGDIDILQMRANGPATLYRNDVSATAGWVGLRLTGRESHRDAYGARVIVTSAGVDRLREVQAQGSFGSQSMSEVHVGLGASHSVERVAIRWPSGVLQSLVEPPADQWLEVLEPRLRITAASAKAAVPGPGVVVQVDVVAHGVGAATGTATARLGASGVLLAGPQPLSAGGALPTSLTLALPGQAPGEYADIIVRIEDPDGAYDEAVPMFEGP
jgi:hypothetical protein